MYYALIAVVVIVHVVINRQAGLSFPTPWPDEAHFLWQARAVSVNNTLFAPELNTARTITWMPPGYMLLTGLYFKIVGTSLESARFLSLLAIVLFFVLLVHFLSHYGHRWYALALSGLFFINARFIACGNIARMEALLLLVVVGAFLLIQRGRIFWGLTILGLSPLLHFNGFYFALSGMAYVWYLTPRLNWRALLNRRLLWAVLIISAGWIGYGLLVLANWDSFVHDMIYQFSRKSERNVWQIISNGHYLVAFWIMVFGGIYAHRSRLRAFELLFLAVPGWLIWPIGHELWYEVIDHTGFLLVSLLAAHFWLHLVLNREIVKWKWMKILLVVFFCAELLRWNYNGQRIENIFRYTEQAELVTMKVFPQVPYFTTEDRNRLSQLLTSLARDYRGLTVEFQPDGDAFAFIELEKEGVQFVCPVFQRRNEDLLIVHMSRNLPRWWSFGKLALNSVGLITDLEKHAWYSRNETEMWFVAVLSEKIRWEERNQTGIK